MNRRGFLKGLMASAAVGATMAPGRQWVQSEWVRFGMDRPMVIRGYVADFEMVGAWLSRQDRVYCDAIPKMIEIAEARP